MSGSILVRTSYGSYGSSSGVYEYEYEYEFEFVTSFKGSSISTSLSPIFGSMSGSQYHKKRELGYGIILI